MISNKIFRIVLTGGPCAGKTTILNEIGRYLTDNGYYVISIAETATDLIKSKILPGNERNQILLFQDLILKQQYAKENIAESYARNCVSAKPIVILYDRAIMDNSAYLDTYSDFKTILKNNNLNELEVLTKYDLVIDLLSTATFMPDKYELNEVRSENVEQARKLDKKTSTAWIHHPNIRIIPPQVNIKYKVDKVLKEVHEYLNGSIYYNNQTEILDNSSDLSVYNENNSKILTILNMYLSDDIIIRKMICNDSSIYLLMKANNEEYYDVISESDAINIMYNHTVIFTESKKEINFIEEGEKYKIIKIDDKLYLQHEKKDDLLLPSNLILNGGVFQKKYRYDNI